MLFRIGISPLKFYADKEAHIDIAQVYDAAQFMANMLEHDIDSGIDINPLIGTVFHYTVSRFKIHELNQKRMVVYILAKYWFYHKTISDFVEV